MIDGAALMKRLEATHAERRDLSSAPAVYRFDTAESGPVFVCNLIHAKPEDPCNDLQFKSSMGELGADATTAGLGVVFESFRVCGPEELERKSPDTLELIKQIANHQMFKGQSLDIVVPTVIHMFCKDVYGGLANAPDELKMDGWLYYVVTAEEFAYVGWKTRDTSEAMEIFSKAKVVPHPFDELIDPGQTQLAAGEKESFVGGGIAEVLMDAMLTARRQEQQ